MFFGTWNSWVIFQSFEKMGLRLKDLDLVFSSQSFLILLGVRRGLSRGLLNPGTNQAQDKCPKRHGSHLYLERAR